MKERCLVILLIIVVLLSINVCFGFDDEGFQYWSTTGIGFDLGKDWKMGVSQDLRLGDDGGNLYYTATNLVFTYKGLADWIDVGVGYEEISEKDDDDEWQPEHKPLIGFTLKGKAFGLDYSNRSRFEYRDRTDAKDLWRYRNKSSFKLPFMCDYSEIQLFIDDEVFFNINEQGYNRNRLFSGIALDLAEGIKGKVYYLWQTTRSGGQWKNVEAIGTSLTLYF